MVPLGRDYLEWKPRYDVLKIRTIHAIVGTGVERLKVTLKIRHDLSFFNENSSAGLFKEDLAFRATLSAKRSSLLEKQAAADLPRDVKFAYRGVCLLKPASTADHLVDKRVTTDHLVST